MIVHDSNNGTDNGLKDHHFGIGHPRHINKQINFIGWPFFPSYKYYSQSHVVMILDPQMNPNSNTNIGEPQVSHQQIPTNTIVMSV